MAIPCFCVKNLTKKPAWKNRQAKASVCYLNLTAADPWQKLDLWRAQRCKELDYTNGKTLRKIFSPYLCAQRELPGSYKIHYSDSSRIFSQIIYQWTWSVTAINSALIKTSIPVSVLLAPVGLDMCSGRSLTSLSMIYPKYEPSSPPLDSLLPGGVWSCCHVLRKANPHTRNRFFCPGGSTGNEALPVLHFTETPAQSMPAGWQWVCGERMYLWIFTWIL